MSLIVPKPKIFSHIKELGAWDLSPEGSAGRLVIGWVDSVIKGGVICAVVYLHVGEGWSERNLEIIQTLGSKLVALNQPFVIMGDFNMSPEEFSQCDFLNQVNASVVAPDTVTFKQAGHSSIIDFFVVATPLVVACDSRPVVNYDGRGPHHSVHLVFNGRGRDQLVNVPVKPSPFAGDPPCGPLRPFFFGVD